MNTAATGTLYGVGVGPGDPELITVKAYRMIQECAVVAYPKKRRGANRMLTRSWSCTSTRRKRRCWDSFFQ